MADAAPENAFIFPLQAVLFPGAILPLRVFEQRYIEMTKVCLRDERPFGVCLIKEGREVGAVAVPEPVGCLARIKHWDMPQLGIFHLAAEGFRRFRIRESRVLANGLLTAAIEELPDQAGPAPVDPFCRQLLESIIQELGDERFPPPHHLDDPLWTGYRLAELSPLALPVKQQLLAIDDPHARLALLSALFHEREAP